ncbi:Predicted transcriptional regulator [Shigella sonnei]|nr:Predicted transcriptional regulator [Shigella sonnei]
MREINEDRVIREDESRLNLGGRSVGWLLSEVMEWVKSRDRINSGKAV